MTVKATALLDYIYPRSAAAYISAEREINVQNFKLRFNIPSRFIQTAALSHSDWALCKEDLPPLHIKTAPRLFKGSKKPFNPLITRENAFSLSLTQFVKAQNKCVLINAGSSNVHLQALTIIVPYKTKCVIWAAKSLNHLFSTTDCCKQICFRNDFLWKLHHKRCPYTA